MFNYDNIVTSPYLEVGGILLFTNPGLYNYDIIVTSPYLEVGGILLFTNPGLYNYDIIVTSPYLEVGGILLFTNPGLYNYDIIVTSSYLEVSSDGLSEGLLCHSVLLPLQMESCLCHVVLGGGSCCRVRSEVVG